MIQLRVGSDNVLNKSWDNVLNNDYKSNYFQKLGLFVRSEYHHKVVYPKYENIFNALKLTDYDDVKVVILGQDPYHGENEAHGLSFSVLEGVKRPPSLENIFKELYNDLGIKRTNNDLSDWARQGVLLLNAIMTVVKDKPLSHKEKGWEIFTDNIIKYLNEREKPIVFILWGNFARSKKALITNTRHMIIESAHPSPLSASRGFFGSKPFSRCNTFLEKNGMRKINW